MSIAKKTMGASALLCASALLIGCAPPPPAMHKLPALHNQHNAATVQITRNKALNDAFRKFFITLNGHPVKSIGDGDTVSLRLNPGKYTLGVKCYLNFNWLTQSWPINLRKQSRSSYQIEAASTGLGGILGSMRHDSSNNPNLTSVPTVSLGKHCADIYIVK
jgi:hypothetical protein